MNEFFEVSKVLSALGDFWYSLYTGREQVEAFIESVIEVQKQIRQETEELEKSLSRKEIPVFRKVLWVPVKLLKSEFEKSKYQYITFDSGLNYNSGYTFGHTVKKSYRVEVASEIISVGAVQERIRNNTVNIIDLVIKNGIFYMDWNPFNTDTTFVRDVYDETGNVIDKEATIWLKDVEIDKEDLYNLFGYVIGIKLPSSEQYKTLINGLMDSLVNGPSASVLYSVLSCVAGVSGNQLKIYTTDDSISDVGGIYITRNLIPGSTGSTFVENKEILLSSTTQDSFTKVMFPCNGNYDEINDILFTKGKANCKKITDACEISEINKILNKPNTQSESDIEVLESTGGLSTWVRTHRFQ